MHGSSDCPSTVPRQTHAWMENAASCCCYIIHPPLDCPSDSFGSSPTHARRDYNGIPKWTTSLERSPKDAVHTSSARIRAPLHSAGDPMIGHATEANCSL